MRIARGSILGKMSMTLTSMGMRGGRAMRGVVCAQVEKVTIDMDSSIPLMGRKDDVRGGEGFHEVSIIGKDGMMGGREAT